jgi:hypothetical protein
MVTHSCYLPTGETLAFEKVEKARVLVSQQQGQLIPYGNKLPRQIREEVLQSKSGKCIYLYEYRNYGHLFASYTDLEKSFISDLYTDSVFQYDKDNKLRCAFELNFNAANSLVEEYTYIDPAYPEHDNYLTYRYENGQVCYLAFYTHPVQRQGYWFSNINDFEYFYYSVFTT